MRAKAALPMLLLTVSCLFLVHPPNVKAQSANVVTLPLTFHGYSLVLRDPNGSLCVYDGADGAPASGSAVAANLESQITGQRSGFNYWSAVIMWAVQLPMDMHVVGTVNIRAYISSTFKLSGLFSGGGYGMGIVDIDENNAEVKEFITEAPYSVGTNPFTATPTQYSLDTNVDYVFRRGHSIGFAVGLGATTQGFSATVYFGSQDRNSGATLPVEDVSQSQTFTANYNGATRTIGVVSNSAVSNCQCDSATKTIQFMAEGINYTTGRCTVSIPKTLMQAPFTVTSGSTPITATVTENSTYYQLSFSHTRTVTPIQITENTNPPPTDTANPTAAATTPTDAQPTPTPSIPEVFIVSAILVFVTVALLALTLKKRREFTPYLSVRIVR